MYYIIVPSEIVEKRGVFKEHTRLSDGSAVVPLSETRFTNFSYGEVKLLNDDDAKALIVEDGKDNSSTDKK